LHENQNPEIWGKLQEANMGNTLIVAGIGLILTGIAYKYGLLGWFGNLPGDIKYKSEHSFIFIPITSMLLVSVLLSLFFWLKERF